MERIRGNMKVFQKLILNFTQVKSSQQSSLAAFPMAEEHPQMNRRNFTELIDPSLDSLEIGPLNSPQLNSASTKYFDILDRSSLIVKAIQNNLPPENVPHIHFVNPTGQLLGIQEKFDVVFSSHVIEHQPDLVSHLSQVSELLRDSTSRYFLIIPDHRFCFDHFIAASNLSEVLDAFHRKAMKPLRHKVIEHWALTTHNDPVRHWAGDHGSIYEDIKFRYNDAYSKYNETEYFDVHNWQFTPSSFFSIVEALGQMGHTNLVVENIWETGVNSFDFFVELKPSR
jgi:SAM-dependent methyltransferase